jgi:hypothetical protein
LTLCEQPRSKVKKRIKCFVTRERIDKKHLHAVYVKELIKKKRINSKLRKKKKEDQTIKHLFDSLSLFSLSANDDAGLALLG